MFIVKEFRHGAYKESKLETYNTKVQKGFLEDFKRDYGNENVLFSYPTQAREYGFYCLTTKINGDFLRVYVIN